MINIVLSIVISLVGYFLLMFFSANLVGMVVRGFFVDTNLQKMEEDEKTHHFIKNEIKKNNRAELFTTLVSIVFILVFLYILFRYLTIWSVIAALLLMIGRIPDLLWEIKHGEKTTPKNIRKDFIGYMTALLGWLALPVLWWAIYSSIT